MNSSNQNNAPSVVQANAVKANNGEVSTAGTGVIQASGLESDKFDPTRIAARQKRYQQWKEFLEIPGIPAPLRSNLSQLLSLYGSLLVDFWKTPSEQADKKLRSLERELESVNDSIRLQTAQTLGREFDK